MSTIKLYKHCKITEDKNFQVDDIELYLNTLTKQTFNNFQYIKPGIDTEIKVTLPQSALETTATNDWNYCSVTNDGGVTRYYFIKEMSWISIAGIRLTLKEDTLNSYKPILTEKTTIQRQHKDRFISLPYYAEQFIEIDIAKADWSSPIGALRTTGDIVIERPQLIGRKTIYTEFVIPPSSPITEATSSFDKTTGDITVHLTARLVPSSGQITMRIEAPATYATGDSDNAAVRKIDFKTEGFQNILFNKGEKNCYPYTSAAWKSYYLIYKTSTAYDAEHPDAFIYENPINCFIASDVEETFMATSGIRITPANLTTNKTYFIT